MTDTVSTGSLTELKALLGMHVLLYYELWYYHSDKFSWDTALATSAGRLFKQREALYDQGQYKVCHPYNRCINCRRAYNRCLVRWNRVPSRAY